LKTVASAILADVEPGFQPGGRNVESMNARAKHERFCQPGDFSGRQDAALYGRPGGPPPHFQTGSKPPANRRGAFTLLEMVAVLAIIAILASLLLPRLIKRIDEATRTQEIANLAAIQEALKLEVIRNSTVPDENGWWHAAARWSTLVPSKVNVNSRGHPRIYYRETSPNPPKEAFAGYLYTQTTNGTTQPASLRAIVVSPQGGFNAPNLAGGALSPSDFHDLWNTPDGAKPSISIWSSWTGTGEEFLMQRVDYAPLFHHVLLINRDAGYTWFTINGSSGIRLDHLTNNAGWDAYFVEGTVVGLCDTSGNLMTRHILTRDISFVFEAGLWRSQMMGVFTGVTQADEFAEEAAGFMDAQWNNEAFKGADQAGVLTTMYSFMYIYTLWANQRPSFPMRGATANQVPEYLMLKNIGENNARLDEFSKGLVQ